MYSSTNLDLHLGNLTILQPSRGLLDDFWRLSRADESQRFNFLNDILGALTSRHVSRLAKVVCRQSVGCLDSPAKVVSSHSVAIGQMRLF